MPAETRRAAHPTVCGSVLYVRRESGKINSGGAYAVVIADEAAILVIVTRRKRLYTAAQPYQARHIAGKHRVPGIVLSVVQRPLTGAVPGGDEMPAAVVKQDQRKLAVKHSEHFHAVLSTQASAARRSNLSPFSKLKPLLTKL